MPDQVHAIFVYGTLKRGQSRAGRWPHAPVDVRPATLQAALYDLGPYPAIGAGKDTVAGELWFIPAEHLAETLRVLDEIEGCGQGGTDLYIRRIVDCQDEDGVAHQAHAYFYANERWLLASKRIKPGGDGMCRWSAARQ